MTLFVYRHPATMPENLRRLTQAHGLKPLAALLGTSTASLKSWSAAEVVPSVQFQKRIARVYLTAFPEEFDALEEVMLDNLKWAEQKLDDAMGERTGPKDDSHKPARRNMLLVTIHLNEWRQLNRRIIGGKPGPVTVVDPDIAELYGAVGDD